MAVGQKAMMAVGQKAMMAVGQKAIPQVHLRPARPDHLAVLQLEGLQEGWKGIHLAVGRSVKRGAYFLLPLPLRFLPGLVQHRLKGRLAGLMADWRGPWMEDRLVGRSVGLMADLRVLWMEDRLVGRSGGLMVNQKAHWRQDRE